LVSDNLSVDDTKSNVYTQTLELGYVAKQPPLYEWLLWLVQHFTGPTLPSFLILKYGLLTATFAFLYLVAKRIFADSRWVTLAALSPLMLYQFAWNLHEGGGSTQTIVLTCAVAASMWSFMRLAERGSIGNYLLFGLTSGLGLISKYNFAGFIVVLLASALLQPALRAKVCNWRLLMSIGAASAVVSPVVYWLITEHHNLVAIYQTSVAPMAATNWTKAAAIGFSKAIWVPLGFLFPLDVIVLTLFLATFREGWVGIKQEISPHACDRRQPDWWLLLLHVTLGGFLVLMLGALLSGATHYLERYMHPFFLLTPLWLLGLLERGANASRSLSILSALLISATLIVVPFRIHDLLHAMGSECRKCRLAVPYDSLAATLAARGFDAGTIIAADPNDAGNLRRLMPKARIVGLHPRYAPPLPANAAPKVAVVWREGMATHLPIDEKVQLAGLIGKLKARPERLSVRADREWAWMFVVANMTPPE
jgi:4-amino-4-deoxy-L-arabinose transferase-like glycosyltransferase